MTKPHIILASASTGRKTLLEKLGVPFSIQISSIDEDLITHHNPYKMLQMRAKAKAEDVVKKLSAFSYQLSDESESRKLTAESFLIIAADSMAILGDKTYGKATNKAHAKQIVSELMGKTHTFATATCIIHVRNPSPPPLIQSSSGQALRGGNNEIPPLNVRGGQGALLPVELHRWENLTKTKVTLQKLDASSLNAYVSRYDFTRFAAGYALVETPWDLVTKIDGSYTNVVGLPFETVLTIFRELGVI